jgi:hypothetical protein
MSAGSSWSPLAILFSPLLSGEMSLSQKVSSKPLSYIRVHRVPRKAQQNIALRLPIQSVALLTFHPTLLYPKLAGFRFC